tara:strand:- start:10 stop:456 length:447 start_codon:yes stop_codon:yes gene_type:complete
MSKIKTFKGQLPIGEQKKLHLATADGLTAYKINKFEIISSTPGINNAEYIGQIFLTDQTGSISTNVDFNNTDLLAVNYLIENASTAVPTSSIIIFDKETFNQDIFVNITDASGGTVPCNYYIELEQFKININESTFATLKNLRSNQQL